MTMEVLHKLLVSCILRNDSAILFWPTEELFEEYAERFQSSPLHFADAMYASLQGKSIYINPCTNYPNSSVRPLLVPARETLNSPALLNRALAALNQFKFSGNAMLLPSEQTIPMS